MNRYVLPGFIATFLLYCGLIFSVVASASNAKTNTFWQQSVGFWASENTYMDGHYKPKIPHYQTLNVITLQGQELISEERKFYPAGAFAASALGLSIPEDKGVQLIQITRGTINLSSGTAEYAPLNRYSQHLRTWSQVISDDTAVTTVANATTGDVSYKMVITMPTTDSRITASLGVNSQYNNDDTSPLRGVSIFSAQRITEQQFDSHTEQLLRAYRVGAIVTIDKSGNYHAQLIE